MKNIKGLYNRAVKMALKKKKEEDDAFTGGFSIMRDWQKQHLKKQREQEGPVC